MSQQHSYCDYCKVDVKNVHKRVAKYTISHDF
jgi:hypothetical protein